MWRIERGAREREGSNGGGRGTGGASAAGPRQHRAPLRERASRLHQPRAPRPPRGPTAAMAKGISDAKAPPRRARPTAPRAHAAGQGASGGGRERGLRGGCRSHVSKLDPHLPQLTAPRASTRAEAEHGRGAHTRTGRQAPACAGVERSVAGQREACGVGHAQAADRRTSFSFAISICAIILSVRSSFGCTSAAFCADARADSSCATGQGAREQSAAERRETWGKPAADPPRSCCKCDGRATARARQRKWRCHGAARPPLGRAGTGAVAGAAAGRRGHLVQHGRGVSR